ncbi:MAG: iron ABC transporter permease [Lentisphaerae bacterium RIFOXYA12_FULL_48_11]|nr:MAG: iron ABC transporter permease [Lentisphaerae bacterium RIFOXYA12_FULL_48_11]
MKKRFLHWIVAILILTGLLAAACIVSLCIGSTDIPLANIVPALVHGGNTIEHTILCDVRLPRILLGVAVGGALSLAGVILQGMFRNPLVEPYTMGISGGAALGVCLAIILKLSNRCGIWSLPVFGSIGATLTILVVYFLSTRRRVLNIRNVLLIGIMISFICSSLITLIMAVSRVEDLHGIIFWIMGSLEQPNVFLVKLAVVVSVLSLALSYLFCLELNALALGEEEALHLGISVENTKRLLFVLASVTTGLSVSVAGVIGFVGLVVPHFMRLFLGSDHRILLVASWLCGGVFLVFCDALARTVISPTELLVGVITGILGGSIFVYVLCGKPPVPGGKQCSK